MKKFTKVLSLFVVLFALVFALTSCGEKQDIVSKVKISDYDPNLNVVVLNQDVIAKLNKEKHEDDNLYLGLFDNVTGRLYLEGATVHKYVFEYDKNNKVVLNELGEPQFVKDENGNFIEAEYIVIEKGNGLPALDKDGKSNFGPYFAGWYGNEGLRNDGARLVTFTEFSADADHIVYAYYIDFVQAILVAVVCILIVFSMLLLLWGLVSLLKFTAPKQKQAKTVEAPAAPAQAPRKAISLADIKDEEMMAAALVATIDYHEETQEDVRVVSIKEIK